MLNMEKAVIEDIAGNGERVLELYISGDTLSSRHAQANLESIVASLQEHTTVTVIDVMQTPKAAFDRRIFATPSLISFWKGRSILIIGDLSDPEAVLQKLNV